MYDTLGFATVDGERDLAINGRVLSSLIRTGGKRLALGDPALIKQLLRRAAASLPSGRCPLYRCAQCGDLACGAITVRVTEVDDWFVWSELSLETPTGGGRDVDWYDDRDERAFYFARAHYLATIY